MPTSVGALVREAAHRFGVGREAQATFERRVGSGVLRPARAAGWFKEEGAATVLVCAAAGRETRVGADARHPRCWSCLRGTGPIRPRACPQSSALDRGGWSLSSRERNQLALFGNYGQHIPRRYLLA
jgi:hypothetical protein